MLERLPIKESGLLFSKMFCKSARLPLPEMGFKRLRVMISFGKGNKIENTSTAPDDVSILTAVISRIRLGRSETALCIPSFAPIINSSKIFTFFIKHEIITVKRKIGSMKLPI